MNFPQKEKLAALLIKYQDLFDDENVSELCNLVNHEMKQIARRVPLHMQDELDKLISQMQAQGIIEEPSGSWCSPGVLKRKKEVTIKYFLPLPRTNENLDRLIGNSWFSTRDLKSGYWQIKVKPEDRKKTSFYIGKSLWQFKVMPFGLCNATATFKQLMEGTPRVIVLYVSSLPA